MIIVDNVFVATEILHCKIEAFGRKSKKPTVQKFVFKNANLKT